MTEREDRETIVELLLLEPEIVAWLGAYSANDDDEADDDEPPRAA
jgi:hypothetical protein